MISFAGNAGAAKATAAVVLAAYAVDARTHSKGFAPSALQPIAKMTAILLLDLTQKVVSIIHSHSTFGVRSARTLLHRYGR